MAKAAGGPEVTTGLGSVPYTRDLDKGHAVLGMRALL